MKAFTIRALQFIRFTDPHDGNISLSNIALMVVLVKLSFVPATTLTDTVPLFLALANYTAKKYINSSATKDTE